MKYQENIESVHKERIYGTRKVKNVREVCTLCVWDVSKILKS